MTVKPSVKIAIQYDPRGRGVYLALAYCRIQRGSEPFLDLYGTCTGYCGGGAYSDFNFHVGEQVGVGFISYTHSFCSGYWDEDRIGVSGLAGQRITDDVETLISYVQHRLWTRWCCDTDEGTPDLTPAAKRRLKCERREVFYTSPGFGGALLAFMSPVCGISVQFGEAAEEWDRYFSEIRKRKRARRSGFITAIVKYPQLIEGDLRLLSNQAFGRCGRTKLTFADSQGGELVVACQWDTVTDRDVERITTLKRDLLPSEHGEARLMLVTRNIDSAVRQFLDQEGISWWEIPWEELRRFLQEERDVNLSEIFLPKNGL